MSKSIRRLNPLRQLLSPLRLAIAGTLLSILSVVSSEIVISSKESSRREIQSQLEATQRGYEKGFHNWELSQTKIDLSRIIMAVLDSGKPEARTRQSYFQRAVVDLDHAFFYRSLALGIIDPKQGEYFNRKQRIDQGFSAGNVEEAVGQTMSLLNKMTSKFFDDVQNLESKRASLKTKEADISQDILFVTRLNITFQILGLIIVLAKDLAPKQDNQKKATNEY
jgi:hypothetical protein